MEPLEAFKTGSLAIGLACVALLACLAFWHFYHGRLMLGLFILVLLTAQFVNLYITHRSKR